MIFVQLFVSTAFFFAPSTIFLTKSWTCEQQALYENYLHKKPSELYEHEQTNTRLKFASIPRRIPIFGALQNYDRLFMTSRN